MNGAFRVHYSPAMNDNGPVDRRLCGPLANATPKLDEGADVGEAVKLPLGEVKVFDGACTRTVRVVHALHAKRPDYLET